MEKIIKITVSMLFFLTFITGCGKSLNGKWTCNMQVRDKAITLNFECRADNTIIFNGANFGATWNGEYILIPCDEIRNKIEYNESAQLLAMMADAVINKDGTVVDDDKIRTTKPTKNEKLFLRIPVKRIDSDHIDLGIKKDISPLPILGFTKTK